MGKIQSVTNENVAEYVNERKALGSEVKTLEEVSKVDKAIAGQEVKPAEPVAPETPKDAKPADKGKNSLQERIDELTRLRKEADEFAEDTYDQLSLAQRRIKELEAQTTPVIPPKVEKPEPKPTDAAYQNADGTIQQEKFLSDWGKWNRDKAIEDFKAEETKRQREAEKNSVIAELEAIRLKSLEAAKAEYKDFDEKIDSARRAVELKKIESPNQMVDALLRESEYQAHILYYLIDHPEEVAKWNKMRHGQVSIAIGRLETKFKPVETDPKAAPSASKPNLPEPTPSLGAGGAPLLTDLSQPMDFKKYREQRKAELAKRGKR